LQLKESTHIKHINQVSSLQIIFLHNVVIQKLICHHNTRSQAQMLIQHHIYNLYLYLTNRLVVIICIVHILMCNFHFPFFYSSPSFLPNQPKCFGKCLTFLSFYTSTLKKTRPVKYSIAIDEQCLHVRLNSQLNKIETKF